MNGKIQFNDTTFYKDGINENHVEKIYDELFKEFGPFLINKLMQNLYDESNDKKDLLWL